MRRRQADLGLSLPLDFSSSTSVSVIPCLKLRMLSPMPLASWGRRFAPKSMRTITRMTINSQPPGAPQNKSRVFKEISMNNLLLFWGAPGGWELIVILVIVLILFGANRLPQLAKGMGESIRNFKQGMTETEVEDEKSSGKDKPKSA